MRRPRLTQGCSAERKKGRKEGRKEGRVGRKGGRKCSAFLRRAALFLFYFSTKFHLSDNLIFPFLPLFFFLFSLFSFFFPSNADAVREPCAKIPTPSRSDKQCCHNTHRAHHWCGAVKLLAKRNIKGFYTHAGWR